MIAEHHPAHRTTASVTDAVGKPIVLVVDDDGLILESVSLLLSHLGYTAVPASTGEEAMVKLQAGLAPVLIILDMDMPGMGGAATLPLIRTLQPDLPVVIATGRLSPKVMDLVARFPKVSLMPKPYGLSQLKDQLS